VSPSPFHCSSLVQSSCLSSLKNRANSHGLSILHMVICFQVSLSIHLTLMDFWSSVVSVLVSVFQHHSSNLAIGSIEWLITNNIAVQETVFSKIKISPVQIRFNFHSQSHIGSNNIFQELLRVTVEVRKNHYLEKKNTEFMVSEKYFGCAVTFIFI